MQRKVMCLRSWWWPRALAHRDDRANGTSMSESNHDGHRRTVALWIAVAFILCGGLVGVTFLITAFVMDFATFSHMLLIEHFTVVVGLPSAGALAFVVVTLFRQGEGPITIKGMGFEIQGAAGPVVLWVLCFLATYGGIKLLW